MNQRERLLVFVTVGLIGFLGIYLFYGRIQKGFDDKQKLVDSLQSKINKQDDTAFEGTLADQNLRKIKERSLPSDAETASTNYRAWLMDLARTVGLERPESDIKASKDEKGVYRIQTFSLKGDGDIRSLVKLLYAFHEKDFLHRLSKVQITPDTQRPYVMKFSLEADAIGLSIADPKQPPPKSLSNRVARTLEEYEKIIIGRNIFGPANQPPDLRSSNSTKVAKGEVLRYDLGAKDPESMPISYALVGDVPSGLKLDANRGTISWEPKELGDYEVVIVAADSGIPSASKEQRLKISVVEPPPKVVKEEKKPDVANHAVVTAFVASRGQPELWINSKQEGKLLYLKVGDVISVGSIQGKLVAIGSNYAEFETDGKRWIVGDSDKNLADAFKRKDID